MCEPTTIALASLALAGAGQMQQYQAEKDRAAAQELKNKPEHRVMHSNKYLGIVFIIFVMV